MSDINIEKALKKDELFNISSEYYDKVYNESPFKSKILDIISILPKNGCKKGYLKYVEKKQIINIFRGRKL